MQVHALMADRHFVSNLLGAPLQSKEKGHIGPDPGIHTSGIAAVLGSLRCFAAGLLGAIATQAGHSHDSIRG